MSELTDLITAELQRSDERDPKVIAARLVMRMSDKDARDILSQVLGTYVRVEIGRHRSRRIGGVGAHAPTIQPTSKWERHISLLQQGAFVDGTWKTFGECTADDFDWLAADRDRKALELAAVATRFRGYASAIRAAGVQTLGDLHATKQVAA